MQIIQKKSSFTLIELLISVAILTVMVTFGVASFSGLQTRKAFVLDGENLVEAIRNTQNRSMTQEGGYAWNIKFTNSATEGSYFEIYSGNYATSSVSLKKTLSNKSSFTNPAVGFSKTISFAAITGIPTIADSLVIKRNVGGLELMIISVNSIGKISYEIELSLIGYWPMDEGTGVITMDAGRNGNTGTLTNGPTWTTGKSGGALNFDGTNDFVSVGNANNLSTTNAITIEAWVKLPSGGYSASHKMIASKGTGAWYFSIYNNKVFFSPWIDGVQTYFEGTKIVSAGVWHHVVASWDSTTDAYRTYLDGEIDVNIIKTGANLSSNASNQVLGYFNSPGDYPFVGIIDDVRIYNRALSATEVKDLYDSY